MAIEPGTPRFPSQGGGLGGGSGEGQSGRLRGSDGGPLELEERLLALEAAGVAD